jgi:hypothetical protein
MQRRDFLKTSALTAGTVAAGISPALAEQQAKPRELYELRIYELRWGQGALDEYLSKALVPALNRLGVKKIGAFSEIGKSEPAKIYLLIPYPSFEDYGRITLALKKDEAFAQASTAYNQIPQDQAVFSRVDTSLLLAFEGIPQLVPPAAGSRVFELRNYESYNEDAARRKVKMFNEGELDIFRNTKLNSVFFGEMIAGKNMPGLTYMIAFKDMAERDANWKAFINDPAWGAISKAPEYANTVSRINKTFLEPLSYSQL